ncbi:Uncharacterised protein [Streptococcus equi subsp. equi]|uniref:hypothetical protein n=1 Tax=Streptococcus TaxID=1301 RepID=UPI00064018D5|nr:hypothetical protein [Streptococcus agalactiae]KLK50629.1 hypothetical protein WA75_02030 [Streptococcus agalactiae]CRT88969.1 Uncharacterised protein [Streptococcus equi subsp. equi]
MAGNIIDLIRRKQVLDEQTEQLEDYVNNGTLESMLVESHIRLTKLVDNLIGIVTTQQEVIGDLAEHVNSLRKRGIR